MFYRNAVKSEWTFLLAAKQANKQARAKNLHYDKGANHQD
jgi:hypothetical protein